MTLLLNSWYAAKGAEQKTQATATTINLSNCRGKKFCFVRSFVSSRWWVCTAAEDQADRCCTNLVGDWQGGRDVPGKRASRFPCLLATSRGRSCNYRTSSATTTASLNPQPTVNKCIPSISPKPPPSGTQHQSCRTLLDLSPFLSFLSQRRAGGNRKWSVNFFPNSQTGVSRPLPSNQVAGALAAAAGSGSCCLKHQPYRRSQPAIGGIPCDQAAARGHGVRRIDGSAAFLANRVKRSEGDGEDGRQGNHGRQGNIPIVGIILPVVPIDRMMHGRHPPRPRSRILFHRIPGIDFGCSGTPVFVTGSRRRWLPD